MWLNIDNHRFFESSIQLYNYKINKLEIYYD